VENWPISICKNITLEGKLMENKNTTTSELFQNPIKNCRNKKKIDTIITRTNVHASSLPLFSVENLKVFYEKDIITLII
jgi:hypothetical protein